MSQGNHQFAQDQYQATATASQPSAAPKTFDKANTELSQCLMPEAQYGRYSSFDGGQSAEKILEGKCLSQGLAFIAACEGNDRSEEKAKTCTLTALIAAQAAIKQFGK